MLVVQGQEPPIGRSVVARIMSGAAPTSNTTLTDAEYRKLIQKPLSRSVDMSVGMSIKTWVIKFI